MGSSPFPTTRLAALVTAVGVSLAASVALSVPATAGTAGALTVTDRSAAPVGTDSPPTAADLASQDAQDFWDGTGVFRFNDDGTPTNSANGFHRAVTATIDAPDMACSDGEVTINASAVLENLGPDSGVWYTGGLQVYDAAGAIYPGSTGTILDSRRGNAGVGAHDVSISVTVPVSELAAGNVLIAATIEVVHSGNRKSWEARDFEIDYVLRCPAVATDDSVTSYTGGPVTFDPLANDRAESAATSTPASLDPATVALHDPATDTWVTTLVTTDGEYAVDAVTGHITFTPAAGFSGVVSEPVDYRVANTDGGVSAPATITPTVAAEATDDTAIALPGGPTLVDMLDNDAADLDPSTLRLVDVSGALVTSLTVPEGQWEVVGGRVSFVPADGYSGPVPPVRYVAEDAGGLPFGAEVFVEVPQAATGDRVTGEPGGPVTIDPLANDGIVDPDRSTLRLLDPATGQPVTELTVPEGVWTADATTGTVTFVPASGFSGSVPPVTYVVRDAAGQLYTAAMTVEIVAPAVTPGQVVPSAGALPQTGSAIDPGHALAAALLAGLGGLLVRRGRRHA